MPSQSTTKSTYLYSNSVPLLRLTLWSLPVRNIDYVPLTYKSSNELANLREMTEANCNCEPRLLGSYIFEQPEEERIPGGYILVLAMEKINGQS